jgi:hypothetical protein
MTVFKYPHCPQRKATDKHCDFKLGHITVCDGQCNISENTSELCEHCKKEIAQCSIYNKRVCYDCAAIVFDELNKRES